MIFKYFVNIKIFQQYSRYFGGDLKLISMEG